MPYDDSNIKKMIKYQTERKVGFSRSKRLSHEVRELIHAMLEADAKARYTVSQVQDSTWLKVILQQIMIFFCLFFTYTLSNTQTSLLVENPFGGPTSYINN